MSEVDEMSKTVKITLVSVLAVLALIIAAYPVISNRIEEKNRSLVETYYEQAVAELDSTETDASREAAISYNEKLSRSNYRAYSGEALLEAREGYGELLNPRGDGIIGYVEIPKIKVSLPIYHGTDEDSLIRGVGHLLGSSLPVGGGNSHAVLTAHSGLPSQRLFTDLDAVERGDVFYIKVLKETLAYQVVEINVVLPEDSSLLCIETGKDLCTLVTCIPYGVNSHRLLVKGERIPFEEAGEIEVEAVRTAPVVQSTWKQMYSKGVRNGLFCAAGVVLIAIAASRLCGYVQRKRGMIQNERE